jgi:hypothetical protein
VLFSEGDTDDGFGVVSSAVELQWIKPRALVVIFLEENVARQLIWSATIRTPGGDN